MTRGAGSWHDYLIAPKGGANDPKGMIEMATMTTADIATELNTTPRTLRKFLRADAKAKGATTPGKGARYAIEKRELRSLRTRFAAWEAARDAERAAKANEAPDAPDAAADDA